MSAAARRSPVRLARRRQGGREQPVVDLDGGRDLSGHREVTAVEVAEGGPVRGPPGGVAGQGRQQPGGLVGVTRRVESRALSPADGLEVAAPASGHHRHPGGHSLDDRQPVRLVGPGRQEDRRLPEQLVDVAPLAQEGARTSDAELGGQTFEGRPLLAVAGDPQRPTLCAQPGALPGVQAQIGPLLRLETLGEQHHRQPARGVGTPAGGRGPGRHHRRWPLGAFGDVPADRQLRCQTGGDQATHKTGGGLDPRRCAKWRVATMGAWRAGAASTAASSAAVMWACTMSKGRAAMSSRSTPTVVVAGRHRIPAGSRMAVIRGPAADHDHLAAFGRKADGEVGHVSLDAGEGVAADALRHPHRASRAPGRPTCSDFAGRARKASIRHGPRQYRPKRLTASARRSSRRTAMRSSAPPMAPTRYTCQPSGPWCLRMRRSWEAWKWVSRRPGPRRCRRRRGWPRPRAPGRPATPAVGPGSPSPSPRRRGRTARRAVRRRPARGRGAGALSR